MIVSHDGPSHQNPSRADRWLQDEVMRASYDPNSTAVLEAMFHLRAPLPLNYYLDRYKGDILIIQVICPHDEVPEDVIHPDYLA
ncbi:unnamed protein product [Calypogeia fissa]